MRLVQALDRGHRVTVAPFQRPGVADQHGLSIAQCEAAAWALAPAPGPSGTQAQTQTQTRYRGAGAINLVLSVALGTRVPLRIYELPGMRQMQDAAYDWVVHNRHRLPGVTPYCVDFPDECR